MQKGWNFFKKYLIPVVRIYLYFLFISLATGCANKEYSVILEENKCLPANQNHILNQGNETGTFTFKDLFPEPELHSLIETALAHSPFGMSSYRVLKSPRAKAGLSLKRFST